jgi:hypothetical protein
MDIEVIVKSWMHRHAPKLLSFYENYTLIEWVIVLFGIGYLLYLASVL